MAKSKHSNDEEYLDYVADAFCHEAKKETDKYAIAALAIGAGIWGLSSNMVAGLAAGAGILIYSDRAVRASNRALQLIEQSHIAAPFLPKDKLKDFEQKFGKELCLEQMKQAHERGVPMEEHAEELLFQEFPELQPKLLKGAASALPPGNSFPVVDLADTMGRSLKPTIISAMPRSGKGVLVANAWRAAKRHHPGLKVYVIDPKAHPDERGYWEGCDRVLAKRFDQIPVNCPDTIAEVEAFIDEWRNDPAPKKLLIFDEQVLAEAKLPKWYREYVPALAKAEGSSGETYHRYLWLVMQSPLVKDIGLSSGSRSIFVFCALAVNRQVEGMNPQAWMNSAKSSGFIPSIPATNQFEGSPRGTLVYSSLLGNWVALPEYPVPQPSPQPVVSPNLVQPIPQPTISENLVQPIPQPGVEKIPFVPMQPVTVLNAEPELTPWQRTEAELNKQVKAIVAKFKSGELPEEFKAELQDQIPQLKQLIADQREDLLRIILLSIERGYIKARHVQQTRKKCFENIKPEGIRGLFNELDELGIGEVIGDDEQAGYRVFSTDEREAA